MAEFNSDDQESPDGPETSGLSGSDKLKSLLAKSRAVAEGGEVEDFEEAADLAEQTSPDDAETSVVSGDAAGMIPPLPPTPGASGSMPAASQSGEVAAAQSGEVPAAQSGEVPAAQSGEINAAQSGPLPAASQSNSGPIAAPENSGPLPTPSSGSFQMNPNASYSGPLPAILQSANPHDSQSTPLSPSGEFGIIPDIGVSQSQEIPVADRPSAKKRRLRAVGVTIVVGVIGFAIVARLIVDQWVSPSRAAVWMGAGTFIPTALVGIILAWPNRESGSFKDTLSGLVPAVAITVAAVVAAGSWSQGQIRAQAVPYAPQTPQLMATILDDEAPEVALAGCERFGKRYDDTDFRTRLFSILTLRPALAMDCMDRLPEDARVAIATSLSDRWTRELLAEEETPNKARLCATAGGLSSLTIDPAEVRGRLLQCTLNAPNEVAQQCCADSLATTVVDPKQWAKHLRETIPYAQDPFTSTGVFAMAFHQEGLTAPQKAFAKKVEFQSPQAQLASLEFACDAIGNGSANVVRHMQAALDGECPVEAGNVPTSESVWQEICFLTIAEIEADRTRPPVSTMCSMTRDVVTGEAVATASELVRLALRRDLEGALAKQIEGGYNMLLQEVAKNSEDRPSFMDENEVDQARFTKNFGYDKPKTDSGEYSEREFQAFLKAYKEQEPWSDAKKRFEADEKRKEAQEK